MTTGHTNTIWTNSRRVTKIKRVYILEKRKHPLFLSCVQEVANKYVSRWCFQELYPKLGWFIIWISYFVFASIIHIFWLRWEDGSERREMFKRQRCAWARAFESCRHANYSTTNWWPNHYTYHVHVDGDLKTNASLTSH